MAARLAFAGLLVAGGCGVVDRRADAREEQAERAFPPIGSFVEVAGRRVHYIQAGSGPDLVLLHGASANLREFTFRFIDMVKDRYRVTAFDRPGLGYTDVKSTFADAWENQGEPPQSQAALLSEAAEKIGVSNPIVLGHSYGGAVALAWGIEHDPAALVVVSGASQPWEGELGPFYSVNGSRVGGTVAVPLISAFVTPAMVKSRVADVFRPQDAPNGYLDYIGTPLVLRRVSFRANIRQVNTLRPQVVAMSKYYPDITIPVEIVHGTADDIVPLDVHAEPLARQLPNARLTRLEGIGHMPHQVARGEVVAAIDRAAERAGLR
ncbi:alpha/beta hydrolase [Palleronia sp. LCG004]|uniref:alpha/beta fold hydrolase n=1 Tax=Palleronia sp. LCG004 TaxID=3079304 RepID=UPI00294265A9|nr:alpha/beta hydrolase [Palleronia sp. LCG004]WOI56738.1 alpha/beta hydrolase [Palleronia sp. LCG004]